jgi:hypothetical protein
VTVRAWRVHDTGLVAVPGRFRRLPGRVRHHQGLGPGWPAVLDLDVEDGELLVRSEAGDELGRWPLAEVEARRVAAGPPVQLVVEVAGSAHLLAAAADAATATLLASLGA